MTQSGASGKGSGAQEAGRGVVVTGAAGGIGFATSRLLVERGFRVFGTLLPSEDPAQLQAAGVTPVCLEVTDAASVREASARILDQLDGAPLAGLVNNAGIADGGPLELIDVAAVRQVFEVNVLGLIAITQPFLPKLRESKGRIINMSSVSGRLAVPFLAPYCASKFAVEAISDSLRRELYPFGVHVIVIQPAVVRTGIWDRAAAQDVERYRGTVYEPVIATAQRRIRKGQQKGLDPSIVAGAIVDALTVAEPATRIPVVKKRKNLLIASWMPDRMLDRMIARKVWKIP
jgi:NAD(P)-dependent dehydrogenase (short-subunit alcohol dehydrogenase family)